VFIMTLNINLYRMGRRGINSRAGHVDFCFVMVLEMGGKKERKKEKSVYL